MFGVSFKKDRGVPGRLALGVALTVAVLVVMSPAATGKLGAQPNITDIEPQQGSPGSQVSLIIRGTNLTGTNRVWLSRAGKPDIEGSGIAVNPGGTELTCSLQLPGDQSYEGAWDVNVDNGEKQTVEDGFTITGGGPPPGPPPAPGPFPEWYLAEGSTDWGFDCYISVMNPNNTKVNCRITYMPTGSPNVSRDFAMTADSQTTISPRDELGSRDFSTKVECLDGKTISVDRTMWWTGAGASSPEAHNSIGVTSPEKTWYLPEGSSTWGFECWLLIQNPNPQDTTCRLTYMIENEGPREVDHDVPANSRATFNMETDIGQKDASIKVEAPIPVIPERAMYRNARREGHDSIGTTTATEGYFLAEGTTAYGFTTYVLVQNPNDTAVDVTLSYMTPDGPKEQEPFNMPASSRKTIRVNDNPDVQNTDVSTMVMCSQPIIAERAMYWDNGTGEACHDSIGVPGPHAFWYLPDGETSNGRETYTLVQAPMQGDFEVQVTYLSPDGQNNQTDVAMVRGGTRHTFVMSDKVPNGRAAILVTGIGDMPPEGVPIIVERSMYWNNRGVGTDTMGGYEDPVISSAR